MLVMHPRRLLPPKHLLLPSSLKAAMAAAAMEVAPVANPAKGVRKYVAMAVARAAKAVVRDVDVEDAVDAGAMVEIAKAARNANVLTPKANPCSQIPISREQTLVRQSQADRSNALTVARAPSEVSARSEATAQAVVASEAKVVNATNSAQKALLLRPIATPKSATAKVKPANPVSRAKVVVVAVAMDAAHAQTAKRATQTAKAASLNWDL